jgi:hypothetical protein
MKQTVLEWLYEHFLEGRHYTDRQYTQGKMD